MKSLKIQRKREKEVLLVSYRFLEIANLHTEMTPLLEEFIEEIQNFTGCSSAGIRLLDKGYWQAVELYISEHSEAKFTHGICPECKNKLYPELNRR
ncbi:MAG: hypothetical protein ACE5QV_03760 [Fidelibacterota bacterium]